MRIKKNFILIAEIASRNMKMIVEGPNELTFTKAQIQKTDLITKEKWQELRRQYPPDMYDVVVIRSLNIDDIRKNFPEFLGWNQITPEYMPLI